MKVRFLQALMVTGTHYNAGEFLDVVDKATYEDWIARKLVEPVAVEIDRLKAVLTDPKIPKYPEAGAKPPEMIDAVVKTDTGETKPLAEVIAAAVPLKKSKKKG